jgi:signal transduction histidine kinase
MINRIKIAMVIFGLLLIAMIGSTLWMNYSAQLALRRSATSQLLHDTDRQAVNLEYFFTERKDDLKDLTASRELSVFFENQALGMSMAYGLRASLIAITQKLEDVLVHKRFYDDPIYTRLLFLDPSGEVRIDIPQAGSLTGNHETWRAYRTPDTEEIEVFKGHRQNSLEVIISAGYYFKGRYAGQLVAVLSPQIIFNHLLKPESDNSHRRWGLLCPDGYFHDGTTVEGPFPIRQDMGDTGSHLMHIDPATFPADAMGPFIQEPALVARIPVKGTPFSIVIFTPLSAIFGSTPPWHLSLIMGILTMVIAGGIVTLWRLNTKNTILHTRLEETAKREQAVKKYQENLECLVDDRTRDLKAAQSELINKAMEAGRAQLSAMVLHNIGNALTPIAVFMAIIKKNDLRQSLAYLSRCHAELKLHQDDLTAFLSRDARGREIFAFMEEVIDNLQKDFEKNRQTEETIAGAVGYISEIITMQQAYAASEHEVKRRIDLNTLVEDAIRMQAGALEKRGIQIRKSLDPGLPPLIIDKNRLMQVLVNIIKNGYEAIDQLNGYAAKKTMRFCTFNDAQGVSLLIGDSGIGVDLQNLSRLFDLGHSGKGSSGFGLYYCKMFVEVNQGTMMIESDGLGCGTTVSIRFQQPAPAEATRSQPLTTDSVQPDGALPCKPTTGS